MKPSKEKLKNPFACSRFLIIFATVAVVLLFGSYESAMSASEGQDAPVDVPRIFLRDGQEELLLPKDLIEHIKTKFAGFRVPTQSDITGYWSSEKLPGEFPFIAWGDFNGSGRVDAALILINNKECKLVIFERLKKGYQSAYTLVWEINKPGARIQRPQQILLRLVKKGEGWTPGGGDFAMEYKYEFDAIDITKYEKTPDNIIELYMSLVYWVNGEYKKYH